MWPFTKQIPQDTAGFIIGKEEGVFYPLVCDHQLFTDCVEKIKDLIRIWMVQDIALASQRGGKVEDTLVYRLMNIDIKFLPYPEFLHNLLAACKEVDEGGPGSRLMDAFVRIGMQIPIEVQRTIIGRFIYAHTYCLGADVNENHLPTKDEWLDLLSQYPWVVYLPFLQELYDQDDIISKVTRQQQAINQQLTQVAVVPQVPSGGAPA